MEPLTYAPRTDPADARTGRYALEPIPHPTRTND